MLRKAMKADVLEIAELMRLSVLEVFPRFHDERETAAAARYLTEPDTVLIDDRTYFVYETDGQVVACGGWSKRDKRDNGSGATPSDDRLLNPDRRVGFSRPPSRAFVTAESGSRDGRVGFS